MRMSVLRAGILLFVLLVATGCPNPFSPPDTDDSVFADDSSGDLTDDGGDLPGQESGSLEPGSVFTGPSGVSIGAPEGAIAESVQVNIAPVDDPSADVPLPPGWDEAGLNFVGEFYRISSDSDVYLDNLSYLAIGLPVPEETDPEDLAFAVLGAPGSVIAHSEIEPWMRWHTERGVYDADSNLFGTNLPFIGEDPAVYVLVEGVEYGDVDIPEEFGNPTIPPLTEQEFLGFAVHCTVEFPGDPCTEPHRMQTQAALDEAHEAWVGNQGFAEPRLQHTVVDVVFSDDDGPLVTVLNLHEYVLDYAESPDGAYRLKSKLAATFYPVDDEHPVPDDDISQHELFHAIQFAYGNTLENTNWNRGIIEGTATAAEQSLESLTRSTRDDLPGRSPRHVDVGIIRDLASSDEHAYSLQDFWVFLGLQMNPADSQLSYLIPLFEMGSQLEDVEQLLRDSAAFGSLSDAYSQWVRNQAFEKTQPLGFDGDGAAVPAGDQCVWSGYGSTDEISVTTDMPSLGLSLDIDPLTSTVFEYTLEPAEDPYTVRIELDSSMSPHGNVISRFYLDDDAGTGDCVTRAESNSRTFDVGNEPRTIHVLVSNLDHEAAATDLFIEYRIAQDVVFESPDGRSWARFGESIAAVGENVLIGSPGEETSAGFVAGRAYLVDSLGNLVQTFEAPDAAPNASFGWSVAAAGDRVLIGAPYHDVGSEFDVGRAYLFDSDGNLLQTLQPPESTGGQEFGYAVASIGETLLVGATENKFGDDPGDTDGKVYMFDTAGSLIRTIAGPGIGDFAFFGSAVDARDDRILVGARFDAETPGDGFGRADLFDAAGNHLETFSSPLPQQNAYFGWDVAITEAGYLIGAPRQETGVVNNTGDTVFVETGQAFLFDGDAVHLETLQSPDIQQGAWFGRSLDSFNGGVLVGAHNYNRGGWTSAGEAYLFVR